MILINMKRTRDKILTTVVGFLPLKSTASSIYIKKYIVVMNIYKIMCDHNVDFKTGEYKL